MRSARRRSGVDTPVGRPSSKSAGEERRRRFGDGAKAEDGLLLLRAEFATVVESVVCLTLDLPWSQGSVRVIIGLSLGSW